MDDFWDATPRDLGILRDAYLQKRAWQAWHIGLVVRGLVTRFDQLLPTAAPGPTASESEAARHRRNAHNFKLWCAVFSAANGKG